MIVGISRRSTAAVVKQKGVKIMGVLSETGQGLVIVAHPDDEIIWCGGLLLCHPTWNWTVICLCRADDSDRSPKFEHVCNTLGVAGVISDLDDGNPLSEIDPDTAIGNRIRSHAANDAWDLVLTHGRNGEYGHERHLQIHLAVRSLVLSGNLSCQELWSFAYGYDFASGSCHADSEADVVIPLTPAVLAEKRRLVREVYGYAADSFEVNACITPESFRRHHI